MKRLFAAIHIVPDENFLKLYADLKNRLQAENIRWADAQNLHITLKFFGETPVEKIDSIHEVLKNIAVNFSPFQFILRNTGIFGSSYKPRVIWFGTEKNEQLLVLTNELLSKLDSAGFPRDRQNFVPHLTLGRMRGVRDKKAFQQVIETYSDVFVQEIKVSEIMLFKSKLYPGGPVYTAVEKYKLK